MLELLVCANLALGLMRAVRLHDRGTVLGGVAALYLLAADTLAVFPISGSLSWFHPFGVMFFGPGVLPYRQAGLLIPGLLIEEPLLLRALRVGACAAVAWRCLHRSAKLNPLMPRAYALDAVAVPFTGAAVLDTLTGIVLVMARHFARPF
jgi:hypothetical protein